MLYKNVQQNHDFLFTTKMVKKNYLGSMSREGREEKNKEGE